jgi:hypothetical protein
VAAVGDPDRGSLHEPAREPEADEGHASSGWGGSPVSPPGTRVGLLVGSAGDGVRVSAPGSVVISG